MSVRRKIAEVNALFEAAKGSKLELPILYCTILDILICRGEIPVRLC